MEETPTFICIDEEEFEVLKKAQTKLLSIQNINKKSLEEIDYQIDNEINYKLEKIEKRQIEQQKFVYDLNGEIRRTEIQLQSRLDEQNKKLKLLRQEYLEIFKNEKKEYMNLFFKYSEKLVNIIEDFKKIQTETDIVILSKKDSKKKERVLEIIKNLKIISESIKLIPHTKFFSR
jgi:hypothetical protein